MRLHFAVIAFILSVAGMVVEQPVAKAQLTAGSTKNIINRGVRCDGMTDGAMVFNAAEAKGEVVIDPGVACQVSTDITFNGKVILLPGASIVPADGVTVTINGNIIAAKDVQIFDGPGKVVANAPWVSVAWWGALAPGADAALAFQAAMGSNRVVFVPPGSYTFESNQGVPIPYMDNAGVLAQNLSNLDIEGYGATIKMADPVAFSTDFLFYEGKNLKVNGLTFAGNRTGLSAGAENVAIALNSIVNFSISGITTTGDWGGEGTPFAGDWLVNGVFSNMNFQAVGQCFDLAFLKNVRFQNFRAVGADTNGNQGINQTGDKCVSVIYDPPLVNYNHTGISYTHTDGVEVTGGSVSNFNSAALVADGQRYYFHNNKWYMNPGNASNGSGGIGILVWDLVSGGSTPTDITVRHDQFIDNGDTVPGYGILLNNGAITNGEVMTGINISYSLFDNNRTTGINASSTTNLTNVMLCGNVFEGANQSVAVGSNLFDLAQTCHTRTHAAP